MPTPTRFTNSRNSAPPASCIITPSARSCPARRCGGALGAHPLALRLAGAWLSKRKQPPEEFQRLLAKDGFAFWNRDKSEKENLDVLFQQAIKGVTGKHPEAVTAWFALTLHAHAPVPLTALCGALGCDRDTAEQLLGALQDYSVAEPTEFPSEETAQEGKPLPKPERAWQLTHALLGEWGREQWLPRPNGAFSGRSAGLRPGESMPVTNAPARRAALRCEEILRACRAWWWKDLKRCWDYHAVPGGPARYAALQPHWESLLRMLTETESMEKCELSAEQSYIATIHSMMGSYSLAQPLFERGLATRERTLGPEHPDTLSSLNNLANLLADKGDLAKAEPLYRRALEARERTLGPEHPHTLASLNNLGELLRVNGNLAGAEPLYRGALAAYERTLGPEHPDTLSSLNNLAILLSDKGDQAEAEPLYRRALAARERTLGPEHPHTLMSLNNLANLLKKKGDLAGAEPLYRRALAAYERTLGPQHPSTLSSLNNLAVLLKDKGDLAGAEPLAERAARGYLAKLGAEHPDTKRAQRVLAQIHELRAKGGKG